MSGTIQGQVLYPILGDIEMNLLFMFATGGFS